MAIDPDNPLQDGPRRNDGRPVKVVPVVAVSEEAIMAARTAGGSWTRATLATWGVSWPPPKGWKERLLKGLPQEPPKAAATEGPLDEAPGPGERIPHPKSPEFDSTKHGLLAPPKVTYRKLY